MTVGATYQAVVGWSMSKIDVARKQFYIGKQGVFKFLPNLPCSFRLEESGMLFPAGLIYWPPPKEPVNIESQL